MKLFLKAGSVIVLGACLLFSLACTSHKVEVSAKEPITINLNVKIEHEIKVKVEKDLEDVFSDESQGLF